MITFPEKVPKAFVDKYRPLFDSDEEFEKWLSEELSERLHQYIEEHLHA